MRRALAFWQRITDLLQSPAMEGAGLLLVRAALAGVFWRSGQSKVVDGTWFHVSDATYYLFENDYSAVPLPPHLAAHMAVACEHLFPALLVAGAFTRLSALALLGMTMVIQIFVFPEAWWSVHILWAALALMLIVRGGGLFSLDTAGSRVMPR